MSKNKGGEFQNKLAKRLKNQDKIDLIDQEELFELLQGDISVMLEQVTNARNHTGRYPTYIANGWANLSMALWFSEFVDEHVKVKKSGKLKSDLSDDELESLRTLIAEGYKKSAQNQYPQQTMEFTDRNKLLSKAFIKLVPKMYKTTKKLGLSKSQRRDLCIQVYGDPVNNMKYIHKIFNHSAMSDKKKLKICREMYGKKRFIDAIGAAMTVDINNSDFLASAYDYMMGLKIRKRAPYVMAYARAYKKNKTSNYRLQGGDFYKKNRKLIKELKEIDIGFKKAFKNLKPKKDRKSDKKKSEKITIK